MRRGSGIGTHTAKIANWDTHHTTRIANWDTHRERGHTPALMKDTHRSVDLGGNNVSPAGRSPCHSRHYPSLRSDTHREVISCRSENDSRFQWSCGVLGLLGTTTRFSHIESCGHLHTKRSRYFNDLSQPNTSVAGRLIALNLLRLNTNRSCKLALSHMRHDSRLYQQGGQLTQRCAFGSRDCAAPQRSVRANVFLELGDAIRQVI